MERWIKCLLILAIMIFFSCTDKEPEFPLGSAKAQKNGNYWKGGGFGSENVFGIGIDMVFRVKNNQDLLRQSLVFQRIPKIVGKYSLNNVSGQSQDSIVGSIFFTLTSDGDVLDDTYIVLESIEQSYIRVTDYDESNRLLSGTFQATYYRDIDDQHNNPNQPDTMFFEMGEFTVTVKE